MPEVTFIIPNWNGLRFLEACLASVASQTCSDYQVFLVDNGSTDGSAEYVREAFPWVQVLSSPANLGFAAAVNWGIRESRSSYVATLNNDVWLESQWVEEMLRAAREGERVGMIASKVLLALAPDRFDSSGISLDRAGFAWHLGRGQNDNPTESEMREVFGPCAAAALYKREMLDQVGLFDEDFFAFLEDADLAWRARLAGWKCLHAPAARAYHIHSATAGQGSSLKAYLLARNRVWTILANYPLAKLLPAVPAIALYDAASLLGSVVAGKSGAALKGRLHAVKGLRAAWRKRRRVQAMLRADSQWETFLCPLAWPWDRWRVERTLARLALQWCSP